MSERRLDEAFRALRADVGGESEAADRTLVRVLATTRATEQRRRRTWMYLLPIAAVLAGSTAWAAATGRMTSIFTAAPAPSHLAVNEATTAVTATPATPAPTAAEAAEAPPGASNDEVAIADGPPAIAADPAPAAPGAERAPVAATPRAPEPERARPASTAKPTNGASAPSARAAASASAVAAAPSADGPPKAEAAPKTNPLAEDKADFQAAYRIHAAGAPGAAVDAWNGYLGKHPAGRFVPEARYARAVALVRSGQHAAAREALRPFADGAPGSYRREDARQLLETLGR